MSNLSESSKDLDGAAVRVVAQVGFPESKYAPPACPDVRVLATVQRNAAADTDFGTRALPVVPVVAVELNDQASGFNRGVGRELAIEDLLRLVLDPERVEEGIPGGFGAGHAPGLLQRVHGQQAGPVVRVGVAARSGAVHRGAVGDEAGREPELASADLADVRGLSSPLPGVLAGDAAEARAAEAIGFDVEALPAGLACDLLTGAPSLASTDQAAEPLAARPVAKYRVPARLAGSTGPGGCALAGARAEARGFGACLRDVEVRTAGGAGLVDAASGAARWHDDHSTTATKKPLGILDPLIRYACPSGGLVVDLFAGSGSTLDAARQAGRRAIGIEANEDYAERAARRLSQLTWEAS